MIRIVLILVLLSLLSCNSKTKTDPTELKMAVTGLAGLEELERDFQIFQDKLNELSGLKIKFYPLSSRTVVIQAIKAKAVDLVLFGPAEYVVTKSKAKIQPIVGLSRSNYYSLIVSKKTPGLNTLEDLKGKKLGVGDFGSTAYHLGPMQLLANAKLDPLKDLTVVNIAKQVGWQALKRNDIDALGLKVEQYYKFLKKEENPDNYQILAQGEELPNDILIAGSHVAKDKVDKIRNVFEKHSAELVGAILEGIGNDKYGGMEFITDIQDEDYNVIRQMFITIGYPEFSKSL